MYYHNSFAFTEYSKIICDNDELFNEMIDQLELDISEGKHLV